MNRIFYLPTVETVGYLKHVCLSWVLIRRLGSWSWFVVLVRVQSHHKKNPVQINEQDVLVTKLKLIFTFNRYFFSHYP